MALIDYCYPSSIPDWEDPPAIHEYCGPYSPTGQAEIDEWILVLDAKEFPDRQGADAAPEPSLEDQFLKLAGEWEKAVGNFSSLTAISSHPIYRQIVDLGKEAVPFLLADLEQQNRFWFPALRELTGIQPFDRGDYGNPKRMTKAWIQWGKRKGII